MLTVHIYNANRFLFYYFFSRRVLCVDAIIDSGDSNSDWRLDFDEYKALMDSSFQPKEKCSRLELFMFNHAIIIFVCFIVCSLEGKKYEDGSQTKVDCNDW